MNPTVARRALLLAALFGLTSALAAAGGAAGEIYAISAVYSVLPDGSVSEMANGDLGELKHKNGHFDAATRTVRLFGAQNEEVAVQIVIPFAGEGFSARPGPIGEVPADRVTFSLIAYAKIGTRLVPDVILPLDGSVAGLKSFDVPLRIKGLPEADARQGMMLLEVWIPKSARPGLHQGTVSILQKDREIAKLKVDLTVFPFAIPDAPTYRLDYLSYGSPLGALRLDAALNSGGDQDFKTTPAGLQAEHQAYRLTQDNRGFLNILPYKSQRGNPLYAYPVKGTGAGAKIVSFEGFDARYGPILDGKTSKYGQPPACFTLAFNINYPFTMEDEPKRQFDFRPFKNTVPEGPGKNPDLKTFEETFRAVAQQTVAHFAEKGWTKTYFEVFFNQKPQDNNRTPWKLDEPVEGADYKGLRYLFNVTKWAFEGADPKGVKIITRLDIGHWECEGFRTLDGKITACYKKKDYNSKQAEEILKPVVDRWVAGHTHVNAARPLIPRYNTPRVFFDEYGGSGQNATHFGAFAGLCWRSFFLGVEGRVFYKAGYLAPTDVSGTCMLYSGKGLGFDGILASRRVKLLRTSVNDYEVLVLARQKASPAVEELLKKLVKTAPAADPKYRLESKTIETYFTNNVEDVLHARRAAAAIAAGGEAGTPLEGFSSRYSPNGAPDTIVGYD
jgi:hypothetical protein